MTKRTRNKNNAQLFVALRRPLPKMFASACCTVQVYDVSSFVSHHPGGVDQIMMGAGRDITQVFESYHNLEISKYIPSEE